MNPIIKQFTASVSLKTFAFATTLIFCVVMTKPVEGQQPQLTTAYAKWVTSYDKAVAQSKRTGKPIMLVFSGSDWCGYCKRLTDEVFMTHEFARWSTDNVIKVEVDFPKTYILPAEIQVQNQKLKTKYEHHIEAYPTILFINADGTVLGKTGYVQGGPNEWVKSATSALPAVAEKVNLVAQLGVLIR